MLYASSKDALRKALVGIAAEIQGTDLSEVSYDAGTCKDVHSYLQCWRRSLVEPSKMRSCSIEIYG